MEMSPRMSRSSSAGNTTPLWTGTVQPQTAIETATLKETGDPDLQFAAMIYLEKKPNLGVKVALSLTE